MTVRLALRALSRPSLRTGVRALERALLVEAGSVFPATIAFLVVFSVLIRDFFWIVMLVSLAEFF